MKYKPVRDRCCQNEKCQDHSKFGEGNIIRHSKYKTRQGRRRRYLCKICKKTFCSIKGTPYYRLHKPRSVFDEVVQMTVKGVGISPIGFEPYSWAAKNFLDSICLYAQVIKKRRKNRVITILYGRIQP